MFFKTKDKIELKVTGMTCSHCESKIETAVSRLPGVSKVTASRTSQAVTVEPNMTGMLDIQKVKEAIQSLGYQVVE